MSSAREHGRREHATPKALILKCRRDHVLAVFGAVIGQRNYFRAEAQAEVRDVDTDLR